MNDGSHGKYAFVSVGCGNEAIRNFYKRIVKRVNVKDFGLSYTSRIKAFVFKYISVAAKWVKTSGTYRLNIYTESLAYARAFYVGTD